MENLNSFKQLISSSYQYLASALQIYGVPLLIVIGVLTLFYVTYQIIRLVLHFQQLKEKYILFELQPLKNTEQAAYTTEQLFTVIHGLAKQRSFVSRLFDVRKHYSFEIASTKQGGITYYVRITEDDADLVKKTLLSYLPGLSIKETSDYVETLTKQHKRVTNFRLSRHFAFPLKHQEALDQHDPIAYLTGSMTKLSGDDMVAFQLVLSPLNKSSVPAISRISKLIYSGKDLVGNINDDLSGNPVLGFVKFTLLLVLRILLFPIGIVVFLGTNGRDGPFLTFSGDKLQEKTPNPYQLELEQLVKRKLDQQLFSASIRLLVASNNYSELHSRERGFRSALSSLNNSEYQALIASMRVKLPIFDRIKEYIYANRVLAPLGSLILSSTEVSDLYHFPYTSTTKTEDLLKQHSKELPAPLSLKKSQNLDIVFAKNTYGGTTTPIGLTIDERRRHVYILGATGTGKSTMLLSMIEQDLKNNKGLCQVPSFLNAMSEVC